MNSNNYELSIDVPSGDLPLIEERRDFSVLGRIFHEGEMPADLTLRIEVIQDYELLRYVQTSVKNDHRLYEHPALVTYPQEKDPGREKLKDFGFPELLVSDPEDPLASLNDATIKCFYNDELYKGIIISGSDVAHGRIMDSDFVLKDHQGRPYDYLPKGSYLLRVLLKDHDQVLAEAEKEIRITVKKDQGIIRFNPPAHKEKMLKWCRDNGINTLADPIPGYLDSWLGDWHYHKGLLKWYRSNDIVAYTDSHVHMFVYLCDPDSTSYATELAYLQARGLLKDPDRFTAYSYDIGEALIGRGKGYYREGKIRKMDELISLYRIDLVDEQAQENVYDLSEKHVKGVNYDLENLEIMAGERFAITGVVRPVQLSESDFILKDDNTYAINNAVDKLVYEFADEERGWVDERRLMMARIDEEDIGKSVFEFYNIFTLPASYRGVTLTMFIRVFDHNGTELGRSREYRIKVV